MQIKRFSIVLAVAAMAAAESNAAPPRAAQIPAGADVHIVLAQSVKERDLESVPPVDAGRTAPPPAHRAGPPAPPPVPPAPRLTTRAAPPPAADDDAPPAREMPPPPTSTSRYTPPPPVPPRAQEPAYRPAPRTDEPAAAAPRRPPPTRSAFYSNCTQQCHLSCEASFEACNGDLSPAKPACVKKLETCRVERCACRLD